MSSTLPQTGDFNAFYKDYHRLVYSIILKKIKKPEDVEDAFQWTLMKIWKAFSSGKITPGQEHIRSWTATVTENALRDLWRKKRDALDAADSMDFPHGEPGRSIEIPTTENQREKVALEDFSAALRRAVASLEERERIIILLWIFNDCRVGRKLEDRACALLNLRHSQFHRLKNDALEKIRDRISKILSINLK